MRCSGCGQKIPFAGKVCPYCQRDKSGDQGTYVLTMMLGVPLAWGGASLFGFWGFIGGVAAAVVASSMIVRTKSHPPEIQLMTDRAVPVNETEEIRLVKLKQLLERKLIDSAEYDKKRSEILRGI